MKTAIKLNGLAANTLLPLLVIGTCLSNISVANENAVPLSKKVELGNILAAQRAVTVERKKNDVSLASAICSQEAEKKYPQVRNLSKEKSREIIAYWMTCRKELIVALSGESL